MIRIDGLLRGREVWALNRKYVCIGREGSQCAEGERAHRVGQE